MSVVLIVLGLLGIWITLKGYSANPWIFLGFCTAAFWSGVGGLFF